MNVELEGIRYATLDLQVGQVLLSCVRVILL